MSEIKKQWYVIRAVGGKENKVKEYIESEIRHNHLEDYISQILIPTEKVYTCLLYTSPSPRDRG